MLKNKKKLRRLERNTPGYVARTAQTLVLAGLLLAPAMAVAAGSPITDGKFTENYTGAAGSVLSTATDVSTNGFNINLSSGGLLYLRPASDTANTPILTISSGSKVTLDGNKSDTARTGIIGNKADGSADLATNGKVVMDGASLDVKNGAAIEVGTVEIKSGTVNVSGYMNLANKATPGLWNGSTIFGKAVLTISGGEVNVFNGGLLAGDDTSSKLNFEGGKTNIGNDGRVIGSGGAIVFGKSGSTAEINVNGGMIFAGTGSEAATPLTSYAAHPSSIANGTITQEAGSTLNVGKGTGTLTDANRMGRVYAKAYTMNGGTINLTDGGRILSDTGEFKAGTITIDGYGGSARSGIYDVAGQGAGGKQTFGTAADSGPKVTITGGGIESKEIEIKGGTFDVSGKADNITVSSAKPDWWKGSLIYAAEKFTMSGGTLNLGDYAQVTVENVANAALKITGGTVNLNGSSAATAAMLRACIGASNAAAFEIGSGGAGTATVNVNGYGRMIGDNVDVKAGGVIDVKQGGHLLVSNDRDAQYVLPAFGTAALEVRDTKLTLTAGAVNVQGDVLIENTAAGGAAQLITKSGAVLTVAGNMTFNTGTLDMQNGGSVYVRDIVTDTNLKTFSTNSNLKGDLFVGKLVGGGSAGALTVDSSDATHVGFYGTGENDQFYDGGSITVNAANSTLHLGGNTAAAEKFETKGGFYSGTVAVSNGNLTVNSGKWNLSNSTTGTSVGTSGALNVNGGTLTVGKLTTTGSGKVNIGAQGNLSTTLSSFGTLTVSGTDLAFAKGGTVADSTILNNGRLTLTGYTGTVKEMSLGNFGKIITPGSGGSSQFGTSTGTLSIDGVTVKASASNGLDEVSGAHAEVGTSNVVINSNKSNSVTLNGGALVGGLTASGTGDVTITTSGNNLTIVGGAAATGGQLVAGLESGKTVTVNGDLTLGDNQGKVAGGGTLTGKVTGAVTSYNDNFTVTGDVGTAEAASGKLNVGGNVTTGGAKATGTGSVVAVTGNVTAGGATANGGSVSVGGDVTGNATATGGSINVEGNLSGGATVTDGGSLTVVGKLTSGATSIVVGGANDTASSKVSIGELAMSTTSGQGLYVDPAFVNGVYNPAQVAIGSFTGGVTGETGVGRNSQVTIGTANTAWLDNQVRTMNAWSMDGGATGVTAALGIYAPTTLAATGSIIVDGGMVNNATNNGMNKADGTAVAFTADTATFAGNSLLVVNSAAGLDGKTALTGTAATSTLNVADTAKLRIANAQSGQTVSIIDGFNILTITADKGWSEKSGNLTTDSHMLYGVLDFDSTNKTVDVDIHARAAAGVFPKLSGPMAGLVDGFYAQGAYNVDSPAAGIRFMSRATNNQYMPSVDAAAATIEGAAQMGAVAGVQISTIGAANAASGAVTTRTSFAQPLMDMSKAVAVHQDNDGALSLDNGLSAGDGMKNGLGVWIMPLYQSNRTWGQKAENFKTGMSSDLGGIALGADYTVGDMFRFGAAFNVGGGYAQSSGDFNKTDNNFNFWGVNLYGGWTMNNFGLSADVGYTSNYNKVEQEVPASMLMGNLKSDITSSAWSAGLKGEYKFETSVVDIIPHIGVRYMGLTTDSYDVKSGGTVFAVEQDFQSIWTFPIGVAFNKTISTDSGWMFKPQVDLSVIPAAGDVKAKSKASIPGVMGDAEMKMQVVDYVTFDGGLGLEMGKDNLSFGINYNIQASEHRTGHGVFGTLRYEF